MKKLILLPFLVFGQFLTHAQKPEKKAQQIITLKLLPAGPVHLPKIKGKDKDKDKDTQQLLKEELGQSPNNKNLFVDKQVIETVAQYPGKKTEELTAVKSRSILYTISSL